jgi:hypothetical protein
MRPSNLVMKARPRSAERLDGPRSVLPRYGLVDEGWRRSGAVHRLLTGHPFEKERYRYIQDRSVLQPTGTQ